jgi:hypothetical protein
MMGIFYYKIKYSVMYICVGVIHLQCLFTQNVYVKAFVCSISIVSLTLLYACPVRYVLGIFSGLFVYSYGLDMFFIQGFKCASPLSNIP